MKFVRKRPRPERPPSENVRADQAAPTAEDVISKLGLKWTPLAGVLAVVFFFWMWLFLDFDADGPGGQRSTRGSVVMLIFSPEIWIGQWFGIIGEQRLPVDIADRLPILLSALFILVASFGPGSLLVSLLTKGTPSGPDRVEHVALAIGAGLNLASLFVLAGGMSFRGSLHDAWWIWLGLLLGLLLLPVAIWRLLPREGEHEFGDTAEQAHAARDGDESKVDAKAKVDFGARLAPYLIGVLSLPYLFGGMLPPWDFDVREYHLQAPKEWLQRGQIDFLPHNVYAQMPLGAELHAITATTILGNGEEAWWLGGLTSKLLISLFAPLTALLLWRIGVRAKYGSVGLVAALGYLTLPWVAHVSLQGLNDAVLGFYLVAAWWVWLRSEQGDWRALLLAGYFAGAAAAVKYPALVFLVLPLFVETLLRKLGVRGPSREGALGVLQFSRAAVAMLLLSIGLGLGGGLWYVKNAIQTGNPVYPLLVSRLGGLTRTPEKDARWVKAHAVPQDARGRRFSGTQLFSKAKDFAFGGDYASPILIPLAVLGAWFVLSRWWTTRGAERSAVSFALVCLGASAFLCAAWFLITHRLERFLVPALPLLALLMGFGYVYAKEQAGSTLARLFVGVGLLYSVMLIAEAGVRSRPNALADPRWFVALPSLRQGPLRPAEAWLQENLQGSDAVLMVGGAAVWDLPGQPKETTVYYNTCFDDCLLVEWLAGKTTPVEQRLALAERNVKYVCVDFAEIRRYRGPGNYGFDPRFSNKVLNDLMRARVLKIETLLGTESALKENRDPNQIIYRVLTSAEAAAEEAAARARQKATQPKAKPAPKAAPATSANQSKTDG